MSYLRTLLRDDAIRRLPLWTVVTALNTSVLIGSIALGVARAGGATPPVSRFVFPLWLAVAIYLSFGPIRTRCRPLDLALPLSARHLWLAHAGAAVLAGALLLTASAAVVVAYGGLLGQPSTGLLALVVQLAAATALAVVFLQGARLEAWRVPVTAGWILRLVGALVAILAWGLLAADGPVALALVPAALAGLLALWTHRSVPQAFDLVVTGGRGAAAGTRPSPKLAAGWTAESPAAGAPRAGRTRWSTLLAILYNVPPWGPFTLVVLSVFVALGGALLSNGVAAWVPDVEMRLIFLPFTVYIMFSITGPLTYRLQHVDPLPVSRRTLFIALMAPLALALLTGYGAGWWAHTVARPDLVQFHIATSRGETDRWVHVPPGYLEIAPTPDVPELTAPWGESHPASSTPLSRRRPNGATIYSPFNTPDESSAAFEAWLLSRAIEAVYGHSVPPEQIVERYFVVEGDRVVAIAGGGVPLRADLQGLSPKPGGPDLTVVLALTAVPFLLLASIFFTTFRARVGDRARKVTFWSVLAVAMLGMIGHIPLMELGILDLLGSRILFEKLVLALGRTPEVLAATWALAAASIVAAYLMAQRQFLRVELPSKPSKFTLVDWGAPNA